jgi:hypothetical protein
MLESPATDLARRSVTKSQGRDDRIRPTFDSAVRTTAIRPLSGAATGRAAVGCRPDVSTAPSLTVADLAAYAEKYGPTTTFVDFRARLRRRHCGSSDVSTIVDWYYKTPRDHWRDRSDPP